MQTDFLILGGGVTGLAAAVELKESAVVLEMEERPGGLVRTFCFDGGYWYDNVLHILHFKDAEIQERVHAMLGNVLRRTPPIAWIETDHGRALYPFQLNIGGLEEETRNKCIIDYAKSYYQNEGKEKAPNYKQFLQETFGDGMCEIFYYPYNEKMYKYPLEKLSVHELTWNLHRPSFADILQGGFSPNVLRETYNTNAFYPCPPKDAPLRGMEILAEGLAKNVQNLRLNTTIKSVHPESRTVKTINKDGIEETYSWTHSCLSTLPLPALVRLCEGAPESLIKQIDELEFTKVFSVAISIEGPRPVKPGHWVYYTNPELPYTRLIYMHEFDEHCAPEEGWALLAEVTWPGRQKDPDHDELVADILKGLHKTGVLNDEQKVINTHVWIANPAYVIFTFDTQRIINNCMEYLAKYNIYSHGRYGKWQYSSMFQNIKEGFDWAKSITATIETV